MKEETKENDVLFHVKKTDGMIEVQVAGEPDRISALLVLMMEKEPIIERMIRIALATRLTMAHTEENKN